MTVAHLGPPTGRRGGPAGYLAQLQAALAAYGSGGHRVMLPPPGPAAAPPPPRAGSALVTLRRLRRTWLGPPPVERPSPEDVRRAGGPVHASLEAAWQGIQADNAPALAAGLEAAADVLFAHDAPSAEIAMARRAPGQQVWLLMHSPMPLALYLAWSFGVPERPWQDVATWPDVAAWTSRELGVCEAVDRLFLPCREAAAELIRCDARFRLVLGGASLLMTGAAAPAPTTHRSRARWGLPADVPVGLFLGTAQPYRGFDLLLDAVGRLAETDPAGVIAVAGCPADQVPMHSRVKALGQVSGVGDLLSVVDFVINVNRFSLFDLSTIEALEASKPMVMSPVGGNLAFRDLGAGCAMLDSLEPAAIAGGLRTAFAMSESDRAILGARSRACYEMHLTPRHLRQRHVEAYDTVAAAVSASLA